MALKRLGGDKKQLSELQLSGQYSPEEAEKIIASGFFRLGPLDNSMVTDEEARQIYLDDVVNAVRQTSLSTTIRCFKFHGHKFDPLPTRDYYRMYAAFSGTWMAERPLRFIDEENRKFAWNAARNDWLAAFAVRRLTAEQMRDAMLTAGGELNGELGGLPVMPEINMEVALQPRMIQFSLAPAYQPSPTPP